MNAEDSVDDDPLCVSMRALRSKSGLSISEVSERSGVPRGSVWNAEHRYLSLTYLHRLLVFYGVKEGGKSWARINEEWAARRGNLGHRVIADITGGIDAQMATQIVDAGRKSGLTKSDFRFLLELAQRPKSLRAVRELTGKMGQI